MTTKSISRALIVAAAAAVGLAACGPKAIGEPPPQTPAHVETSADAGLPAVPLTGRGVVVPSDVKLQPGPRPATTSPATGAPSGPATPTQN